MVYEKTSGMFFQSSAGSVGYRPTACGYIDHWGSDGLSVRRCSPNQHQVLLQLFYSSPYRRQWGCFEVGGELQGVGTGVDWHVSI